MGRVFSFEKESWLASEGWNARAGWDLRLTSVIHGINLDSVQTSGARTVKRRDGNAKLYRTSGCSANARLGA